MPIIIQSPGSAASKSFGAMGQIMSGYATGKKDQAELAERKAKQKYYEQLAIEKELANRKAQQRTDFLSGQGVQPTGGEGVPSLLAKPGTATQDDFGWRPPMLDTGAPEDLSKIGPGYLRKENAAFRASLDQPNVYIPGTDKHPLVVRALEGSGELARMLELRDRGLATPEDLKLIDQLSEGYSANLESAFAQAQSEIFNEALAKFHRELSLVESGSPSVKDTNMTQAFRDKLAREIENKSGPDVTYQSLWADLQDMTSDFFEVHTMMQVEQSYVNQFKKWQAEDDFESVIDDVRLSPFYEEGSELKAMALLGVENMTKEADLTDSEAYADHLRDVSAAYDIISIGKQGKSRQWMPVQQAGSQKEMLGNLIQAQYEGYDTLRQDLNNGEEYAKQFVLESRALYENAPVDPKLTGQALHAAKWRYMIDQQDKALNERGLVGLPEQGYAWVLKQLPDEKLPEGVVSGRSPVHSPYGQGPVYSPGGPPLMSDTADERPEAERLASYREIAETHRAYTPKRAARLADEIVKEGAEAGSQRTTKWSKAHLTELSKGYVNKFKTEVNRFLDKVAERGTFKMKSEGMHSQLNLAAQNLSSRPRDERLYYMMLAYNNRHPGWADAGHYHGETGLLTPGFMLDESAPIDETWQGVLMEAAQLASAADRAKAKERRVVDSGFKPHLIEPADTYSGPLPPPDFLKKR